MVSKRVGKTREGYDLLSPLLRTMVPLGKLVAGVIDVAESTVNYAKRVWYWAGIVSILLVIVSVTPVSRLAVSPQSVRIFDNTVFIERTFPGDRFNLPRPIMSYVEYVRGFSPSTNGGRTCQDSGGPFRYTAAKDIGVWDITWAEECMSDPIGFEWEACWKWHIGALKLGPTCKRHVVFTARDLEISRL